MKKIFTGKLFSILLFLAIPITVYFVNVEVQSYWGRQAVENTNLESLSLAESLAKAKTEKKLVIVEVAAIWCGTCRKLDNQVFANEKVRKAINERFIFSRLEFESIEGTEFLEKNNAVGFPTLWLLGEDGNVIKRLNVTFSPDEFLSQLP
jgi:thiol:disulfide interchange protein